MTDVPILFSAAMVRALLAGRKTQTRRLATSPLARRVPGDRLYVREAWRTLHKWNEIKPRNLIQDRGKVTFEADPENRNPLWAFGRLRPAMHMPRWASRLVLTVTDVRIEPLVGISDRDALAEGVQDAPDAPSHRRFWLSLGPHKTIISAHPAECYAHLWAELHTAEGQRWRDNPDVVALTFTVAHGNIDHTP